MKFFFCTECFHYAVSRKLALKSGNDYIICFECDNCGEFHYEKSIES